MIQYGIDREQTAVEAGRSRRVPDVDHRVPVTLLRLLTRLVMMLMMLVKLPTITQRCVVVLHGGGRRHSRRRSAVDQVPPERRQRKNPARIHLVDSPTLSALLQFQRSPPARRRSERVHATYNLSATVQPRRTTLRLSANSVNATDYNGEDVRSSTADSRPRCWLFISRLALPG